MSDENETSIPINLIFRVGLMFFMGHIFYQHMGFPGAVIGFVLGAFRIVGPGALLLFYFFGDQIVG